MLIRRLLINKLTGQSSRRPPPAPDFLPVSDILNNMSDDEGIQASTGTPAAGTPAAGTPAAAIVERTV